MATWTSLAVRLIPHALTNPRTAIDLLALGWVMRRRQWWRHAPFLPLPPPEYVRWRMYTAYGDEAAVPPVGDVLRYARWRRDLLRS